MPAPARSRRPSSRRCRRHLSSVVSPVSPRSVVAATRLVVVVTAAARCDYGQDERQQQRQQLPAMPSS